MTISDLGHSITYSHWDPSALSDITKTYRIWYKCDDIWVLQDGVWKMQYSKVTNMGPGVEAPPGITLTG